MIKRLSNASTWKCLPFCAGFVLACLVLSAGCRKTHTDKNSNSVKGSQSKIKRSSESRVPVAEMPKEWLSQTWLEAVSNDFGILVKLLRDSKPEEKADAVALMQNRYDSVKQGKRLNAKGISSLQRAFRVRLHLRLARFYKQAFGMSLRIQLDALQRRMKLKGKLKVGKLLQYYRGRLLCFQGDFRESLKAFKEAEKQVGSKHQLRLKVWQSVCQKEAASRERGAASLAKLAWSKEPEALAELLLLQAFFQLSSKPALPAVQSPRIAMFSQVLANKKWAWKPSVMKGVVDVETIGEGKHQGELKFFDPGVLWAAASYHAQTAELYLASAKKKDRFASFFRAEAYRLQGKGSKALKSYQNFLVNPPQAFAWGYVIFSARLRLADFVAEAKARAALLEHQAGQTKVAVQQLQALAKERYPSKIWAGWGLLQVYKGQPKAKWASGWSWMWAGAELAPSLEKKLLKRYLTLKSKKKGAAAIVEYRLYRYAIRNLYLLGSQGALWANAADKAQRWMEILHHKEKPYSVGLENQPEQILLTAHVYARSGRFDVATKFMYTNKLTFPVLNQHWEVYGLLRIFKGMGGPGKTKSG